MKEFDRSICFKLVLPPHVHPLCRNRDTRGRQQTAPAWPWWAHNHGIVLVLQSWHLAPPNSPILPILTLQVSTNTSHIPLSLPSCTPLSPLHAEVLQSDGQHCTHTEPPPPQTWMWQMQPHAVGNHWGWFNGWGFHARGAAAVSQSNDDSLGWAARQHTLRSRCQQLACNSSSPTATLGQQQPPHSHPGANPLPTSPSVGPGLTLCSIQKPNDGQCWTRSQPALLLPRPIQSIGNIGAPQPQQADSSHWSAQREPQAPRELNPTAVRIPSAITALWDEYP